MCFITENKTKTCVDIWNSCPSSTIHTLFTDHNYSQLVPSRQVESNLLMVPKEQEIMFTSPCL